MSLLHTIKYVRTHRTTIFFNNTHTQSRLSEILVWTGHKLPLEPRGTPMDVRTLPVGETRAPKWHVERRLAAPEQLKIS